ncbi:hypothetical protein B0H14DRAFT_2621021 [Mycena olivaceomarginata]|nr:hypothetical protein B0H14DRAFT_2621021 [Mycena olivaceomarginata]
MLPTAPTTSPWTTAPPEERGAALHAQAALEGAAAVAAAACPEFICPGRLQLMNMVPLGRADNPHLGTLPSLLAPTTNMNGKAPYMRNSGHFSKIVITDKRIFQQSGDFSEELAPTDEELEWNRRPIKTNPNNIVPTDDNKIEPDGAIYRVIEPETGDTDADEQPGQPTVTDADCSNEDEITLTLQGKSPEIERSSKVKKKSPANTGTSKNVEEGKKNKAKENERKIAHTLANPGSTKYNEIEGNEALERLANELLSKFLPQEKLKKRMRKADLLAKISSIQNQRM